MRFSQQKQQLKNLAGSGGLPFWRAKNVLWRHSTWSAIFEFLGDLWLPWVPKMCRPSANTENSRRTREKPLVPRVIYGVHLRTKITENKIQFEVQKLDYPCRNLVIWIWNRNERNRNSIIRTWSHFEQVETIKGKLDIADVELQITIPTKMQITWFELQFTFPTLISHLIVNNATIIFHKIPNETFNLNLKSRHIFEFEKPKFQFERNIQEPEMIRVSLHCT